MSLSTRRVKAIVRKELREYRHNGGIVWTMAVIPLIFVLFPLIEVLALPASSASSLLNGDPMAILLGIPALVPAVIAAYSVVGERQQATLEPLLTTPIPRDEFLLGKALAAFLPSLAVALAVYGLFLVCVRLFAQPAAAAAVFQGPDLLAQLLFTPLVAAWSIWVGIGISARSSDVRVAQQLGSLASLPPIALAYLVAFNVIHATLGLGIGAAVVLLILVGLGWRITSAAFDRERLITGTRQ
jgi:ABC-type transport system involved in multi-copper enzyme maturation permease subunit